MRKIERINETGASALANICRVAAERFQGHVKELGSTHPGLAEQFEKQAKEALALADIFDQSYEFDIPYEIE